MSVFYFFAMNTLVVVDFTMNIMVSLPMANVLSILTTLLMVLLSFKTKF